MSWATRSAMISATTIAQVPNATASSFGDRFEAEQGEADAAIAQTVRDLCAAATAWNDVDVCDIPINEAAAPSSPSSAPPPDDPPPPDADETAGQDDLRRKIDELQKQLAELSAQVAGS